MPGPLSDPKLEGVVGQIVKVLIIQSAADQNAILDRVAKVINKDFTGTKANG